MEKTMSKDRSNEALCVHIQKSISRRWQEGSKRRYTEEVTEYLMWDILPHLRLWGGF